MRTLLDTSVAIALRNLDRAILDRAAQLKSIALLSVLSVVEMEGGVPAGGEGASMRRLQLDELYATLEILEFGLPEAEAYRLIVEKCGFSRPRILDRMIAAQAFKAGAIVATLNPRDFREVPGLMVEDWSK